METSHPGATAAPGGAAKASVDSDPASGQAPKEKQQGAQRPNESPDDKPAGSSGPSAPGGGSGAGGAAAGGRKLPDDKSNEEGTGVKYVKTSGVAAEGGDFDATKPGAGAEATRLMDQGGIHRTEGSKPGDEPDKKTTDKKVPGPGKAGSAAEESQKEKESLGTKMKKALH